MRKLFYLIRKVAKLDKDGNIRGLVMDIMMGVLEAKRCVIDEVARGIKMKAWTLHKRIQMFEKYCDEGMIDINYRK